MPEQVSEFLAQAQPLVDAVAPPSTPDEPKVPFPSNLKLSGEREKKMIEHAFRRLHQLEQESGRDQTLNPQWWANQSSGANSALASQGLSAAETFMGKRSRYDATFLNDVSWRPFTFGTDNIFRHSNIAIPLVRRIARQMIARAKNAFFGSDPWLSIDPAPVPEYDAVNDAARADKIEKFARFKLDEAESRESLGRAISRALILGECAVKTSYVVRDQVFNVEARVLHGVDGEPIRSSDGNYITESDQFIDAGDGLGTQVLARDQVTPLPDAPIWSEVPLNRRQVLFEGARSEVIYFKDFLCPLTATNIQEADTVIHTYDKPVMSFVDLVVKRGLVGDGADDRLDAARRVMALVKALSDNTPAPKAAVAQELRPNENFAAPPNVETGGPVAEFVEFYLWYDADGDGVAENIQLICDRNTQMPIFYDHVANVTVDGLRPIEIVRVNPVEGRWYGQGIIELFDSYQLVMDLLVNRWNFSQSRAGRVDFFRATDTLEGDRDPSLKLNWGQTYTPKPGADIEKILKSVYLTDIKFEQIHLMMQYFAQLLMNESGVTNANDNQAAGMQSAKLATGLIQVSESGDELFRPILDELKPAITRIVNREVDVILANVNPTEVFTYLEGDTQGIERLTTEEVHGLRFKTRLRLTSVKNNQQLQMSAQASALVEKFYMLMPEIQQRVVGFYKRQLQIMDPGTDPDTVLVPMIPMLMPGAPAPGGAAPGGPKLGDGGPGGSTPFAAQLTQAGNAAP